MTWQFYYQSNFSAPDFCRSLNGLYRIGRSHAGRVYLNFRNLSLLKIGKRRLDLCQAILLWSMWTCTESWKGGSKEGRAAWLGSSLPGWLCFAMRQVGWIWFIRSVEILLAPTWQWLGCYLLCKYFSLLSISREGCPSLICAQRLSSSASRGSNRP